MSFFRDDTSRLRTAWRLIIFGCGFAMVQIGLGILSAIGLAIYLAATGSSLASLLHDSRARDDWQMRLSMATAVPMTLCNVRLALVCRRFLDRRNVWSMGLMKPANSLAQTLGGGFLIGSVPVVLAAGILLGLGGLTWHGVSASAQTALLVPVLLVMAFSEEIVCRGYLLQNLIDIRRRGSGPSSPPRSSGSCTR